MAFTHEIKVRWGDCDSARIVYTAKIPDFALTAIEAWWEDTLGLDWYRLNLDENIGAPFVHLDVDFKSPITPRHMLICQVQLARLGASSVSFQVEGHQNGVLCFEGSFVQVFTSSDSHVKVPVPEKFKERLQRRCAAK